MRKQSIDFGNHESITINFQTKHSQYHYCDIRVIQRQSNDCTTVTRKYTYQPAETHAREGTQLQFRLE